MYESYYHLRDKPFQLNPDPRFFFASRGHKRAFVYLDAAAVQEVIGDLQQEVHHQLPMHHPAPVIPAGGQVVAPAVLAASGGLPEDLDVRLEAIERTLSRLVPMVRKVLYTVTSAQESE
jgi:hypothetical protein